VALARWYLRIGPTCVENETADPCADRRSGGRLWCMFCVTAPAVTSVCSRRLARWTSSTGGQICHGRHFPITDEEDRQFAACRVVAMFVLGIERPAVRPAGCAKYIDRWHAARTKPGCAYLGHIETAVTLRHGYSSSVFAGVVRYLPMLSFILPMHVCIFICP